MEASEPGLGDVGVGNRPGRIAGAKMERACTVAVPHPVVVDTAGSVRIVFLKAGSSTLQVAEGREHEASADLCYIRQSSGAWKLRPENNHFLLVEARPIFL